MTNSESSLIANSKLHRKKYLKWGLVLLIIGVGLWYWWSQKSTEEVEAEAPEVYRVEVQDIRSLVSSDGNIINPDIANLSFLINGTLGKLYVEEGQEVKAGMLLAELDKSDLYFDLRSAQNDVNISFANIKARQADVTDNEIILANNDLDKIKQDFELTKNDLELRVDQSFSSAQVQIESAFSDLKSALNEVDYLLGVKRTYAGKTLSSFIFNNSILYNRLKSDQVKVERQVFDLESRYNQVKSSASQAEMSRYIWQTNQVVREAQTLLSSTTDLFDTAHGNANTSESDIIARLAVIENELDKLYGIDSALTQAKQSTESALLAQQNGLRSAANSVSTAEVKFNNTQKTTTRSEISKQTGLDIQYAQLAQSKLRVDKANYNLSLADLKATIDGVVVEVNGSEGETIKVETANSDNAFIKILSDANFTTEVNVEETDIAKIELGQKVLVTLEAIEDLELEGIVSFISSTFTRDSNGIISYLVRIDIADDQGAPIREGMTTEVNFVRGEALDVVAVPNEALIDDRFVILENGGRTKVETGFSDGQMTEIKSGLSAGDVILIGATEGTRPQRAAEDNIEERMKAIGERLEESGNKPSNWDRMSVKEQQDYLQELRGGAGGFNVGGSRGNRSGGGRPSGGSN